MRRGRSLWCEAGRLASSTRVELSLPIRIVELVRLGCSAIGVGCNVEELGRIVELNFERGLTMLSSRLLLICFDRLLLIR